MKRAEAEVEAPTTALGSGRSLADRQLSEKFDVREAKRLKERGFDDDDATHQCRPLRVNAHSERQRLGQLSNRGAV